MPVSESKPIRLACADFTWRRIPHRANLALIAALGFDGVDIAFIPNYTAIDPTDVRRRPQYWAGVLSERVSSCGLELADFFPIASLDLHAMALNHPDVNERKEADDFFRDMLSAAKESGACGMTIVPGMVFKETWQDAFDRAVSALQWRVEEASRQNVPLSVECHIHSVLDTPERAHMCLDRVPGLLLTLDYGHFVQQGIAQGDVDELLPFARHVHFRGGGASLVQTRFDQSEIDFGPIVDKLLDQQFHGWLSVEYIHDERPGCAQYELTEEVMAAKSFLVERLAR